VNRDLGEAGAARAWIDVSAYTDEEGVVHVTARDGDRVYEVEGRATAVLEQLFDNPVNVFFGRTVHTFRPPKSWLQFTLRIQDAKATVRGVPARAVGGEA
jgi:hypothetical protein